MDKRELTEAEAAYIAGFLDGEGSINVLFAGGRWVVEISADGTDPRPLRFMHERLGGSVYLRKQRLRCRPIWRWAIKARNIDSALPQLLPFLLAKPEKATLALEMRSRMMRGKRGRGVKIPADEAEQRLRLVSKAKEHST